ncbi:hypothetical protein E4U17_002932 [Claviceps sp. LM77 group G4]|nr:hypothetical protein E4U17_002932 [Claviceps sp. LM77 group G4]KAG6073600.1 hypothetical protein E4U33_002815 [Claviceps sp. LM78 group G4]KAG6081104.1 hypothetical protein E4U16_007793 [Claviceps sp. LM84 group G4]
MRILLLNPNSSTAMTDSMLRAAKSTPISASLEIVSMTATSAAPASINNDQDIQASTDDILASLAEKCDLFRSFDSILIACFSVHTLVPELSSRLNVPIIGIFEASILTALSLLRRPSEQWGIVTTGEFWEKHLCQGIDEFLGISGRAEHAKFAGVFSSGLTAGELHSVDTGVVRHKLGLAARRLLMSGNVTCVVMGCGGMAGLEDSIRSAAVDIYGESRAKGVYVVDGVKAGILQLHQAVHSGRTFQ